MNLDGRLFQELFWVDTHGVFNLEGVVIGDLKGGLVRDGVYDVWNGSTVGQGDGAVGDFVGVIRDAEWAVTELGSVGNRVRHCTC